MSNKKDRERRREERVQQESQVSTEDRRKRLLQFGAGAVFLVIAAVVVLIVVNSSSNGDTGDTNLEGVSSVDSIVGAIPQEEMVLGDPKAPVELIEYGDLQCPVCKSFSEEQLPPVIEGQVKKGEAKLVFRNFLIIGPQSAPAGAAAVAAGLQGRGWNYLELFYKNQGKENSGYADDDFLEAVAKGAGVKDIAKWNKDRASAKVTEEVQNSSEEASRLGFTGTPSFAIKGPSTNGMELLGTPETTEEFEAEITKAG